LLVVIGTLSLLLTAERALADIEPRAFLKVPFGAFEMAFSPDGKLLATANGEAVKVWDLQTNRVKHTLKGFTLDLEEGSVVLNAIPSLSFSGDGALLATTDVNSIKLWDVRTGKVRSTIDAHVPWRVRFSPDGKTLAWDVSTADYDRNKTKIKLWDVEAGEERASFKGCGRFYFTPDGDTLVAEHPDFSKGALLWDVKEGKRKAHIKAYGPTCFSPDGKTVAGVQGDESDEFKYYLKLWDVETGKEKATGTVEGRGLTVVAFTPDGKALVVMTERRVMLYAVATLKEKAQFKAPCKFKNGVALSPDGKTLAVSGSGDDDSDVAGVWLFDVPGGGAAAPQPGRSIFTYKNDSGTGTFKHLRGNVWVEHCPNGDRPKFEEVTRNNRYIEIYDKKRDVGVRIYANNTLWRNPEDTRGKWEMLWEGEWTE
jgi:WD40 repeat protein